MELIVAVDQNWAIGKDGDQLAYISEDLKRFKALTTGHPVILGRKTLATFPGGRPLKGRRNLILSRDPAFRPEGAEVYAGVDALLAAAPEDSFVIGGASVYNLLLDRCETAHVTRIDKEFSADTWFPDLDERADWALTEEEGPYISDGLSFSYLTYRRTCAEKENRRGARVEYQYLRTGPDGGWRMSPDLYAKCPKCSYYMSLDPATSEDCPCGNLYKECGRFGANTGDASIEIYQRTDA